MVRREPRTSPAIDVATPRWQLAQLNAARAIAPYESAEMATFMARLDEINALGEAAPGFVWRLKNADGNTIGIGAYPDPLVVFNLSVWESIDDLFQFAYRSGHADVFRRRKEWFGPWGSPSMVLWWIPAGTEPTMEEALVRLDRLARDGPTVDGFTFKARFDPPVASA
jgi:hypothetical protein